MSSLVIFPEISIQFCIFPYPQNIMLWFPKVFVILCFRVIPCIFHISMSIRDHGSGIASLSMKFWSFWWYYHWKWMEFDLSCAHAKFGYFPWWNKDHAELLFVDHVFCFFIWRNHFKQFDFKILKSKIIQVAHFWLEKNLNDSDESLKVRIDTFWQTDVHWAYWQNTINFLWV